MMQSFRVLALVFLTSLNAQAFTPLATLAMIPQTHPVALSVAVTGLNSCGADLIAQRISNRQMGQNKGLDKRRLGAFSLYGVFYLGLFQHHLFSNVYTKLFPMASTFAAKSLRDKLTDHHGAMSVVRQVSLEALLRWPWLCIPVFYVLKELATPGKFNRSNFVTTLRQNWKDDLMMCWKVWVPVALINFSCFPLAWQVPFTSLVSFCYMVYFSLKRGAQ